MSTYYSAPTSTSFSPQPHESADHLGLNNHHLSTATSASTLLSSNSSQTFSNPATPSHNTDSTPAESLLEDTNYPLGELDDDFQGVNFDAGVQRVYSIPSALLGSVDYQAETFDHQLAHLPPLPDHELSFQSLDSAVYPLSPSTPHLQNTPYYRNEADNAGQKLPASNNLEQQKLQLHPLTPPTQRNPATGQLTPGYSVSSKRSAPDTEPRNMAGRANDNHLVDPRQDDHEIQFQSNTSMYPDGHYQIANRSDYFGAQLSSQLVGQSSMATGFRDDEGRWESNERTGQAGLDPESRQPIAGIEIPNLKEQEEQQRIDVKNVDIREWRSHASGSSETLDEPPDENSNVPEVDDAASIRENRLVEGQVYYHVKNEPLTEADSFLMQQSRHWDDAPELPYTTTTTFQPQTASEAIKKFHVNADAISLSSRVATWGTRRRSEPSLADIDAIADGSFLKKLTVSKPKDADRPRSNSILDQGLSRLARWSVSGRGKRSRSPENPTSLRHSSSVGKKANPVIATAPPTATGLSRNHSTSATPARTSPKSPPHLGFPRSIMQRARSRSDLSHGEKPGESGLVDLWRGQGGPPVPSLSSPPMEAEPSKPRAEAYDQEEEEDDDDEQGEENDVGIKSEQQGEPIVPNYTGFKEHVRRLNRNMNPECGWLVSRIGRQQETRYKTLLELRANHFRAVMSHTCSSRHLCLAASGSGSLLDVRGYSMQPDRNASELQLVTEFSDDSIIGDGALTSETFHAGIPMPPTRTLPAEFECQLCFKAKKFGKPSDWTKHVHEDLQPFTCTFSKCKEPKSFKRKADWVRHENERHRRLEWWKCELKDCDHVCYRKDNFLQHLVREHKYSEPRQKTKAAIKKAHAVEPAWDMLEQCHHETTDRPQDEPCKFCGKTFNSWKKLMVHHGKHMEQISLPILQLVEGAVVNANTIISPIDQNPTPITPINPQKMEPASPYMMDKIPLHGSTVSQFTTPPFAPTTTASPMYGMTAQIPHDVDYNQPMMYPDTLVTQPMGQPQNFNFLTPSGMGNMNEANTFLPTDPGFSSSLPMQGYGTSQSTGYTIPNSYVSAAPVLPDYQTQYMIPVADPNLYDLDSMGPNRNQSFQGVPRTQGQGNSPSYGYSPQNGQRYYGHPQ